MGHDLREPSVDSEAENAPETPPEPIARASAPPEPIQWTAAAGDEPYAPPEPLESTAAADDAPATETTPAGRKVITIKYHPPYDALAGWMLGSTPERRPVRHDVRPERPALVSKWTRAAMLFVLWMVVLGTSLSVSGGDPNADVVLPAELLGIWRTEAPKYADSFFELSAPELVFGTEDRAVRSLHRIDRVTRRTDTQGVLYTIWYATAEDRGSTQPFRLYHDSSAHVLTFHNQLHIPWERVGPPGELKRLVDQIEESSAHYEEQYGHIHQRPNLSPEAAAQ